MTIVIRDNKAIVLRCLGCDKPIDITDGYEIWQDKWVHIKEPCLLTLVQEFGDLLQELEPAWGDKSDGDT